MAEPKKDVRDVVNAFLNTQTKKAEQIKRSVAVQEAARKLKREK